MFLLIAYLFLFRQPGTIAAPIYTASLVPDYYNTSTLLPDGSAPACRGRTVLDNSLELPRDDNSSHMGICPPKHTATQ